MKVINHSMHRRRALEGRNRSKKGTIKLNKVNKLQPCIAKTRLGI